MEVEMLPLGGAAASTALFIADDTFNNALTALCQRYHSAQRMAKAANETVRSQETQVLSLARTKLQLRHQLDSIQDDIQLAGYDHDMAQTNLKADSALLLQLEERRAAQLTDCTNLLSTASSIQEGKELFDHYYANQVVPLSSQIEAVTKQVQSSSQQQISCQKALDEYNQLLMQKSSEFNSNNALLAQAQINLSLAVAAFDVELGALVAICHELDHHHRLKAKDDEINRLRREIDQASVQREQLARCVASKQQQALEQLDMALTQGPQALEPTPDMILEPQPDHQQATEVVALVEDAAVPPQPIQAGAPATPKKPADSLINFFYGSGDPTLWRRPR